MTYWDHELRRMARELHETLFLVPISPYLDSRLFPSTGRLRIRYRRSRCR